MNSPLTQGVHHIGLTVSALEESAHFFTTLLGWKEVKRKEDYPAIFVSDGTVMLTLWQAQTTEPVQFDRKSNVGLHHLAIKVIAKRRCLRSLRNYQRITSTLNSCPLWLAVARQCI